MYYLSHPLQFGQIQHSFKTALAAVAVVVVVLVKIYCLILHPACVFKNNFYYLLAFGTQNIRERERLARLP
jgi:hypothetical protein